MYRFKRDIFSKINTAIKTKNVVFLTGPRKCGKTVCLKQIEKENTNAKYVDFKSLSEAESQKVFDKICKSIEENEDILYLLDEITYAFCPEREINRIANAFTIDEKSKTKVVFTGSQSAALESWANRSFCGHNAITIKADFLNYSEWLRYTGEETATEENYYGFLYNVDKFYKSPTIREYLSGCLEETIISNAKTTNYLLGNECDKIDVSMLIDVCYAVLFTLHNHVNAQAFFSGNRLTEDINYFFPQATDFGENTKSLIDSSFVSSHLGTSKMTLEELKQALLFLYRCNLLTITPVATNPNSFISIYKGLYSDNDAIKDKNELFRKYNFSIAYPSFYIQILRDILKEKMPENLPKSLLGSLNECYIRGILPQQGAFELHDPEDDSEIDYINIREGIAIEITIADKKVSRTHFNKLPEKLLNVLLSKSITSVTEDLVRIPFYSFAEICCNEDSLPLAIQISETAQTSLRKKQ